MNLEHINFWPIGSKKWYQSKVERKILYTSNKLEGPIYFGEKEFFAKSNYTLNVCSAERNCELIIIPKNEFYSIFTKNEAELFRS